MIAAPVGHQCPNCVAEARREYRQGPGRRVAIANAKATSVTSVLLVLMAAGFVMEVATGGAGSLLAGPHPLDLVRLGASVGLARLPDGDVVGIAAGQEWRMVSAIFLHGGILHLLMNAYALWIFGPVVERELGRARFLLIFLTTGLAASAASYAFTDETVQVGVGASGAIFGVVGAFVSYNYRHRHLALASARLRGLAPFLILNLVLSFTLPFIDWRAHLGGFVAGVVAGFVAEGWGSRSMRTLVAVGGFTALTVGALALAAWRTAHYRADFPGLL
jgi:membrane associated rhomboid family serine protease